jgi:hypothetical protein
MPDLRIEVQQRYASEDAIILKVMITGHHLGPWRGLLPTGRSLRLPLCGIFVFDEEDRLAGEKIYCDRDTLRQLEIFHEPAGILGLMATVLSPRCRRLAMADHVIGHMWPDGICCGSATRLCYLVIHVHKVPPARHERIVLQAQDTGSDRAH